MFVVRVKADRVVDWESTGKLLPHIVEWFTQYDLSIEPYDEQLVDGVVVWSISFGVLSETNDSDLVATFRFKDSSIANLFKMSWGGNIG